MMFISALLRFRSIKELNTINFQVNDINQGFKGYLFNTFKGVKLLAIVGAISATPVVAQTANFASVSLSPGFPPTKGIVTGYTGGSYSLSTLANRDRNNNPCIGFGDPTPDHVMTLERDFSRLKLQLNSQGYDTTLLVQGPGDNPIRCGDDSGKNKDASIEDLNWKAGTYRIWVGAFDAGVERKYTLSVLE